MKTNHKFALGTVALAMLLGLGGCSSMSSQDKSTAIGAVGGVIGHEVGD